MSPCRNFFTMVLIGEIIIYLGCVGISAFATRLVVLRCINQNDDEVLDTRNNNYNYRLINNVSLHEPLTVESYSHNPELIMTTSQDSNLATLNPINTRTRSSGSFNSFDEFLSEDFERHILQNLWRLEESDEDFEFGSEEFEDIKRLKPYFEWDTVKFEDSEENMESYYTKERRYAQIKFLRAYEDL